jgi:hypothetical protein
VSNTATCSSEPHFSFDQGNPVEFHTIVQRSKRGHLIDGRFDFVGDPRGANEFPSSVDNPMPNDVDLRKLGENARLARNQGFQKLLRRVGAVSRL